MNDSVFVDIDKPNRSARTIHPSAITRKKENQANPLILDKGFTHSNRGLFNNLKASTDDIALDHMIHLQEFHVPIVM